MTLQTDIDDIDGDTNGFGHKIGGYPAFTTGRSKRRRYFL